MPKTEAKPAVHLVEVAQWVADKHVLKSRSFRATMLRSTDKAVFLRLRDGKELWVPWRAVLKMEEVDDNGKAAGR